jgi:hypothetical protein
MKTGPGIGHNDALRGSTSLKNSFLLALLMELRRKAGHVGHF